jgi:hypothetical protein
MYNYIIMIPAYAVMFFPVVLLIVGFFKLMGFLNKITAPPKLPPHVQTPEEVAASKARVLAMMAQVEKSRLAHHH